MFIVNVYNDKSVIIDDADPQGKLPFNYSQALRDELSYEVPNAEWSSKYKLGQWDGKISIYNKRDQSFPTGLTNKVKELFDLLKVEYKFNDQRQKPDKNYPVTCDFGGKELRDYQLNSGTLAAKYQRGMLALCTGAGKTMTSCQIFSELAVSPVVFIVPAIELLKQTQKEFEKYLRFNGQPVKVGIAGGGLCDLNMDGVNVITYQTALNSHNKKYIEKGNKVVDDLNSDGTKSTAQLQKELDEALAVYKKVQNAAHNQVEDLYSQVLTAEQNETKDAQRLRKKYEREVNNLTKVDLAALKKAMTAWDNRQAILLQKSQVRELLSKCNAFIVDEAHVASVVIEELGKCAVNAYYKLGLSGTPWRTDNQEIRIEGTLGRKIIQVSASDLIERGFLVQPKIFLCKIKETNEANTYAEIYNTNIVNNWERNYKIKQFSENFQNNGRPTLILVERREHGVILEGMIENSVFVPGGDKGDEDPSDEEKNYRRRMLNAVENNEIILIATQWANVGVDAPKISSLILAGSCQSSVTTYQQVGRVLRCVGKDINDSIKNGKPDAIIVDFYSDQKHLKSHSSLRKKVYKNERAWKFYELN